MASIFDPGLTRRPGTAIARVLGATACAALLLLPLNARADAEGVFGPMPLMPKDEEIIRKSGEAEELFVRRGHVLPDGPEAKLVSRVGQEVAPHPPTDPYMRFRFAVIDSPVPNAFALPDGQVYIHSGLLALLENEAQLASVLAHECTHVEGHHSVLNARQARHKAGGMLALSVLLGDIGNIINIAFIHAIIGYGRDLEAEADRHAVDRVLEAGYDPREMPRVFELLDQDPEGDTLPVKAAWSDHPLNVERARTTREMLDAMAPRIDEAEAQSGGLVVGEASFLEDVASSARRTVDQLLARDRPRTALGLANRLVGRWPDDADVQAMVGDSLSALDARTPTPTEDETRKSAKRAKHREAVRYTPYERERKRLQEKGGVSVLEQNRSLAAQAYDAALALQPDAPRALAGKGRLLEAKGQLEDAGRLYARYLRTAPADAPARAAVLQHLTAVTAQLERRAAVQPAAPASRHGATP